MSATQVDFVDWISRRRFGEPAPPALLNRVASGGLLLPLVSTYAVLAAVLGWWGDDTLVAAFLVPDAVYLWIVWHPTPYLALLGFLGGLGLLWWWHPNPAGVHNRIVSTVAGMVVLAATFPAVLQTVHDVLYLVGCLVLYDAVLTGLRGETP